MTSVTRCDLILPMVRILIFESDPLRKWRHITSLCVTDVAILMLDRTRRYHAIASRRHRARLKLGKIMVNVEIDAAVLDWLVRDAHWLSEGDADVGDRALIGQAISCGLAASAKAAMG